VIVDYWEVGSRAVTTLPMTTSSISAHLRMDWLPELPDAASSLIMGWPPYLIEDLTTPNGIHLAFKADAKKTERQWKGVMSWMLGVAGARHVLEREGYRWVAPLSAFYPGQNQTVAVPAWSLSFPQSSLEATKAQNSKSRVKPDYIALRPLPASVNDQQYEFGVAEAKGTHRAIASLPSCPLPWYNQARNISLTLDGAILPVPRNLVIATRVNPNAENQKTRRLQVRAWNQADETIHAAPAELVSDVVSAHLFGLFKNLRLPDTARAIANSVELRANIPPGSVRYSVANRNDALNASDEELARRLKPITQQGDDIGHSTTIETELGRNIEVILATQVIDLVQKVCRASTAAEFALVVRDADREITSWVTDRKRDPQPRKVVLPFGAEITFPQEIWH